MENDILDSLNDLGYGGPLSEEVAFSKALDGGPKSLEYTKLVHILSEELKKLLNLEETVSIMDDPDESSSFLLELSSFLKELGCPYKNLIIGHMSARLQTREDRLLLLDYMISELMAARMVSVDCPKEKQSGMEIIMQESPTAKDLKEILIALKFNKPPPNISPEMLFSKLEAKLKDTIQKEGEQLVGKPLYNKALSEKEWKSLDNTFKEMYEEYRLRRETLITRLECTIQSFEWSDRLKTKKDVIQSSYRPKREQMKVKPDVKLSDFLAARTSLLQVEKTSSANVRKNTQSDVNKVIIGQVPDRGGRPNEQQPPPPEMPSWQQRTATQGGGRGGGRGGGGGGGAPRGGGGPPRGGGRGGRVQGSYNQNAGDQGRPQTSPAAFNQNQNRNYQTYEVPPGGYNQNQGYQSQGYNQNQGYSQNQGYQSQGSYQGQKQYSGSYSQSYDNVGNFNQGQGIGRSRSPIEPSGDSLFGNLELQTTEETEPSVGRQLAPAVQTTDRSTSTSSTTTEAALKPSVVMDLGNEGLNSSQAMEPRAPDSRAKLQIARSKLKGIASHKTVDTTTKFCSISKDSPVTNVAEGSVLVAATQSQRGSNVIHIASETKLVVKDSPLVAATKFTTAATATKDIAVITSTQSQRVSNVTPIVRDTDPIVKDSPLVAATKFTTVATAAKDIAVITSTQSQRGSNATPIVRDTDPIVKDSPLVAATKFTTAATATKDIAVITSTQSQRGSNATPIVRDTDPIVKDSPLVAATKFTTVATAAKDIAVIGAAPFCNKDTSVPSETQVCGSSSIVVSDSDTYVDSCNSDTSETVGASTARPRATTAKEFVAGKKRPSGAARKRFRFWLELGKSVNEASILCLDSAAYKKTKKEIKAVKRPLSSSPSNFLNKVRRVGEVSSQPKVIEEIRQPNLLQNVNEEISHPSSFRRVNEQISKPSYSHRVDKMQQPSSLQKANPYKWYRENKQITQPSSSYSVDQMSQPSSSNRVDLTSHSSSLGRVKESMRQPHTLYTENKHMSRPSHSHRFGQMSQSSSSHRVDQMLQPSSSHRVDQMSQPSSSRRFDQMSQPSSSHRVDQMSQPSSSRRFDQMSQPSSSHRVDQMSQASSSHRVDQMSQASSSHRVDQMSQPSSSHRVDQMSQPSSSHRVDQMSHPSSLERDNDLIWEPNTLYTENEHISQPSPSHRVARMLQTSSSYRVNESTLRAHTLSRENKERQPSSSHGINQLSQTSSLHESNYSWGQYNPSFIKNESLWRSNTLLTQNEPTTAGIITSPKDDEIISETTVPRRFNKAVNVSIRDVTRIMNKDEIEKVETEIIRLIDSAGDYKGPQFLYKSLKSPGCIVLLCANEYSKNWVFKNINKLNPYKGAKLVAKEGEHFHARKRIGLSWIPDTRMTPDQILSRLKNQNRGEAIDFDSWKVAHTKLQDKVQQVTFSFKEADAEELKRRDCKLFLNAGQIKIRLISSKKEILAKRASQAANV